MPTIVQPPGAHGGPSSPPAPGGSGGGGATVTADTQTPHMHHGWADLRNSMNHHLPNQLTASDTAVRAAYRVLAGKANSRQANR